MKKLVLAFVSMFQFGFGQATPPSKDKIIFQQVLVPADQTYYCGAPAYIPFCNSFNELVALNDPRVDVILAKYKIQVIDTNGAIIFPRP